LRSVGFGQGKGSPIERQINQMEIKRPGKGGSAAGHSKVKATDGQGSWENGKKLQTPTNEARGGENEGKIHKIRIQKLGGEGNSVCNTTPGVIKTEEGGGPAGLVGVVERKSEKIAITFHGRAGQKLTSDAYSKSFP